MLIPGHGPVRINGLHVRYVGVSALAVVVAQATLSFTYGMLGWPVVAANLAAFVAGCLPSYSGNRRWTWRRRGRSDLRREVLPFVVLSVASLGASTGVLLAVEAASAGAGRLLQTVLLVGAALTVTVATWLVRFLVLDRAFTR